MQCLNCQSKLVPWAGVLKCSNCGRWFEKEGRTVVEIIPDWPTMTKDLESQAEINRVQDKYEKAKKGTDPEALSDN
jgi:DNA-directed RNA polymerase subunit M/transcription elongation factor TFIIS